jgi:hypothetical protein
MLRALAATGIAIVVLAVLWLIGRFQIVRDMRHNEQVRDEVVQYHNALVEYVDSEGRNHEAIVKLMAGSPKMQRYLGFDNVVYNTRVNFTIYNNVFAIPMLLEALQEALVQWGRDRDTRAAANAIQNVLIRHGGRRDDRVLSLHERAKRPLLCVADGWKTVVGLPISFLRAFGLLSEGRAERTKGSFWFKLYSAILFLATVGATAIAYIADRDEVDAMLRSLF